MGHFKGTMGHFKGTMGHFKGTMGRFSWPNGRFLAHQWALLRQVALRIGVDPVPHEVTFTMSPNPNLDPNPCPDRHPIPHTGIQLFVQLCAGSAFQ